MKTVVVEVKKDDAQLREEKTVLSDKVDHLTRKSDELDRYLGGFAKKMYGMLEGTSFWSSEFLQTFRVRA